jgi:hypothetical protein
MPTSKYCLGDAKLNLEAVPGYGTYQCLTFGNPLCSHFLTCSNLSIVFKIQLWCAKFIA